MGNFRLPDGSIIDLPGVARTSGAASKSGAAKPVVPRATRTANGLPSQAELVRRVKEEVAKSVEKAEARERAAKATALEDQARSWRQRALDGRVSGLDREIREHLVRKAVQAETEAERLRSGSEVEENPDARNLESAAGEYRERALKADTPESRRYFYDKEREFRARAEIARNGRS